MSPSRSYKELLILKHIYHFINCMFLVLIYGFWTSVGGQHIDTSWGFLSNFFFFFFFLTDGVDANFLLDLVIWFRDGFFIRCLLTPGLSSKRWPEDIGKEKRPSICLVDIHCLAGKHIQAHPSLINLGYQSPGSWRTHHHPPEPASSAYFHLFQMSVS